MKVKTNLRAGYLVNHIIVYRYVLRSTRCAGV
jgi:hypothetical protein